MLVTLKPNGKSCSNEFVDIYIFSLLIAGCTLTSYVQCTNTTYMMYFTSI